METEERIAEEYELNGVSGVEARPIVPSTLPRSFPSSEVRALAEAATNRLDNAAKLFAKLGEVQGSIGKISATGRHEKGYAFAKDEEIVDVVNAECFKAKLVPIIIPVSMKTVPRDSVTAEKKAAVLEGTVEIALIIADSETGFSYPMGTYTGFAVDYGGDSQLKKAMTAARKTALTAAFNIAISDGIVPPVNKGGEVTRTAPLSTEPGSLTSGQSDACMAAYQKAKDAHGDAVASKAATQVLTGLGVRKFAELTERDAANVPTKLLQAANKMKPTS